MKGGRLQHTAHLDAIRGCAALVVFLGHGRDFFLSSFRAAVGLGAVAAHETLSKELAATTTVGHQAVIVFFVLSGYLVGGGMARALRERKWSCGHYIVQRMTRLWTVLLPALLLTLVLDSVGQHLAVPGSIYEHRDQLRELRGSLSAGAFVGNLLFLQNILVPTFGTNGPLWSLAYEGWYYVMFPLLSCALTRRTLRQRVLFVTTLGLIMYFVGWEISIYFLIWLMGAVLDLIQVKIGKRLSLIGLLISLFSFFSANIILLKRPINIIESDFILAGTCFSALFFIIRAPARKESHLYSASAGFLGKISYTLYLVHVPILVFLSSILVGPWRRWPIDAAHIMQFMAISAFAFILAFGIYLCFERNTDFVREWVQGQARRIKARSQCDDQAIGNLHRGPIREQKV